MKYKLIFISILASVFIFSCGESQNNNDELTQISAPSVNEPLSGSILELFQSDAIAFRTPSSDTVMTMKINGENLLITPHTEGQNLSQNWPEKELIVSRVCGNEMESDKRIFNFLSPDGGTVEKSVEEWFPPMKPDGKYFAISCILVNEEDELMIVTDDEVLSDRADWSRTHRSELSDKVNIFLINAEGSHVHNMTYLDKLPFSGEWLPQWSPDGKTVIFETNIDGDSEIAMAAVETGVLSSLTRNNVNDQNPVWSKNGKYILWSRQVSDNYEIFALRMQVNSVEFSTGINGRPVPWDTWSE
jgi:hypothetical protein